MYIGRPFVVISLLEIRIVLGGFNQQAQGFVATVLQLLDFLQVPLADLENLNEQVVPNALQAFLLYLTSTTSDLSVPRSLKWRARLL